MSVDSFRGLVQTAKAELSEIDQELAKVAERVKMGKEFQKKQAPSTTEKAYISALPEEEARQKDISAEQARKKKEVASQEQGLKRESLNLDTAKSTLANFENSLKMMGWDLASLG